MVCLFIFSLALSHLMSISPSPEGGNERKSQQYHFLDQELAPREYHHPSHIGRQAPDPETQSPCSSSLFAWALQKQALQQGYRPKQFPWETLNTGVGSGIGAREEEELSRTMTRMVNMVPQIDPRNLQASFSTAQSLRTVSWKAPYPAFHSECDISRPSWTAEIHSSLLDKFRSGPDV